jgi:hypothetical protein
MSIGSPTRRQPCRTPIDPQRRIRGDPGSDHRVGEDLIVVQLDVRIIFRSSPADPPTSGTSAPTTPYAPRTISC